ncbi:transposase family protein [Streptomyces sp. NPDC058049]|uniref:helix-turn-helix domain-containing protein n=1 Tax=Streptomyces sp. NPDC058049 TaxID=3346314 RepID=UPI0036E16029
MLVFLDRLLVPLVHLRHGVTHDDLACRFQVDRSTFTRGVRRDRALARCPWLSHRRRAEAPDAHRCHRTPGRHWPDRADGRYRGAGPKAGRRPRRPQQIHVREESDRRNESAGHHEYTGATAVPRRGLGRFRRWHGDLRLPVLQPGAARERLPRPAPALRPRASARGRRRTVRAGSVRTGPHPA